MKQLTIRPDDKELERVLLRLAREGGLSLNQAALSLMKRGAGLAGKAGAERVGTALDGFIGTWSRRDEKDFLAAIRCFESVDEELWR